MPNQTWVQFTNEINEYFYDKPKPKKTAAGNERYKPSVLRSFLVKYFCSPALGRNKHLIEKQREIYCLEGDRAHEIAERINDELEFSRGCIGDDNYFHFDSTYNISPIDNELENIIYQCHDLFGEDDYYKESNTIALRNYLATRITWENLNRDKKYSIPFICRGTHFHHYMLILDLKNTYFKQKPGDAVESKLIPATPRSATVTKYNTLFAKEIVVDVTDNNAVATPVALQIAMPTFWNVIGMNIFHPVLWTHVIAHMILSNSAKLFCTCLNWISGDYKNSIGMNLAKGIIIGIPLILPQFITLFFAKYTTWGEYAELCSHENTTETNQVKKFPNEISSEEKPRDNINPIKKTKTVYLLAEFQPAKTAIHPLTDPSPQRKVHLALPTTRKPARKFLNANPTNPVLPPIPNTADTKYTDANVETAAPPTEIKHRRFKKRSMSEPHLEKIALQLAEEQRNETQGESPPQMCGRISSP